MQLKKIILFIIISLAVLINTSFASRSPSAYTTTEVKATKSDHIGNMLLKAISLIGIPYKKNGTNPDQGLDDAGFVHYLFFSSMGINLPNTTQEISKVGKSINLQEVEPGDLLFFNTKYGSNTYVAIYLGNNRFIQASPIDGVKITKINSSWGERINVAKRVVQENEDDGGHTSFESFQAVNTTSDASATPKPLADSLINAVEISCDYLIKKHKYKEGLQLCLKDAMAGDISAQTNLGYMYNYGNGVAQDYNKAFLWYSTAAAQGDSYAQSNLGDMYYTGHGVTQDYNKAFFWYYKAAAQGDSYAQYSLGGMYYVGNGVAQNYQEAIQWYTKSATQGNADAQYNLGIIYYNGNGVPKNYQQAFQWFTRSANQHNIEAQNNLGVMYKFGEGVTQNYQLAFELFKNAAEENNADAQTNLASLYHDGLGVSKDYRQAFKLYTKSANQGNTIAQQQLMMMQKYNEISILDQINLAILSLGILVILIFGTIVGIVIYKFSKLNDGFIKNGCHKINKLCRRLAIIIAILSLIPVSTIIINNATSFVIGVVEGIVNAIAYFLLYLELDKTFQTKLTRIYILSIILAVISLFVLGIGYFIFMSSSVSLSAKIMIVLMSYITYFLLPITLLHRTGLNIDIIAESTSNHLFSYSAKLMKIAAYTMPIFVGVLILIIAQILFLFACIMDDTITLPKN
ncbi:MAG: peptidoglycan endopeptidase [Burkholderiales bacterium]|jgi:TPR repeat protein|nr:peptidoglycan endopeptidase [Burkholderiales bacterium]